MGRLRDELDEKQNKITAMHYEHQKELDDMASFHGKGEAAKIRKLEKELAELQSMRSEN